MRCAVALLCILALVACGGGGGSVKELCTAVRADRSTAAVFSGFDPSDQTRALQQLREARVTLGELRDAAPNDQRHDIDVEIAYVQALVDGLAALTEPDPAKSVEIVRQVTAEHPDVARSAAALEAFSHEHCGT